MAMYASRQSTNRPTHGSSSSTPSFCLSSRQARCPSRAEETHWMCRLNVLHQQAVRLSLLHWQHAALAKVFQRWKEYKGRRAQLFGSLIALARKWEQPLMEDAWAAWREYTVESKRIKVKQTVGVWQCLACCCCYAFLHGLDISSLCIATTPMVPKWAGASDSCWELR